MVIMLMLERCKNCLAMHIMHMTHVLLNHVTIDHELKHLSLVVKHTDTVNACIPDTTTVIPDDKKQTEGGTSLSCLQVPFTQEAVTEITLALHATPELESV